MYLVAIDPGVSTGVIVLRQPATLGVKGLILNQTVPSSNHDILGNLLCRYTPSTVLCEQGPAHRGHHRVACERVEQTIQTWCNEITWIRPSQWKSHPYTIRVKIPERLNTKHERDALLMAAWYCQIYYGDAPSKGKQ